VGFCVLFSLVRGYLLNQTRLQICFMANAQLERLAGYPQSLRYRARRCPAGPSIRAEMSLGHFRPCVGGNHAFVRRKSAAGFTAYAEFVLFGFESVEMRNTRDMFLARWRTECSDFLDS
jgi:hypothetical protein